MLVEEAYQDLKVLFLTSCTNEKLCTTTSSSPLHLCGVLLGLCTPSSSCKSIFVDLLSWPWSDKRATQVYLHRLAVERKYQPRRTLKSPRIGTQPHGA